MKQTYRQIDRAPLVRGLVMSAAMLISSAALAAASPPYCRKVQAAAASDAALLMAPQLVTQAYRFPGSAQVDPGLSGGRGQYQIRVGLTFSPLDLYKGVRVMSAAEADCSRHQSQVEIESFLPEVANVGKLSARREQARFLEAHRKDWLVAAKTSQGRLAIRSITFLDDNELQKRVTGLELQAAQVQGEADAIEASGLGSPAAALSSLAQDYSTRTNAFEKQQWKVRAISPWQLRLTGGIVPAAFDDKGYLPNQGKVDWYGVVELSFNFGAFKGDSGYLQARRAEVQQASYELVVRLAHFRQQVEAALSQARRELASVERQVGATNAALSILARSEAPNQGHAVALLGLDQIWFESDRVYLQALVAELSALLASSPPNLAQENP